MVSSNFPDWLKKRLPAAGKYNKTFDLLKKNRLHTVCESAGCPNMGECFSKSSAAFLILGNICTRGCLFCDIKTGQAELPDSGEPARLLRTVKLLDLKYVVITSVTRDDLPDGGAEHFAAVIKTLKAGGNIEVEVLIPDLKGDPALLSRVLSSKPDVIAHNVEMVKELYPRLRPLQSDYKRTLRVLKILKEIDPAIVTKTGFMAGLGETKNQLSLLIKDIAATGCDILTIGQYLMPSKGRAPVEKFYTPEEFEALKQEALMAGIKTVYSGPFIRSSFNAREVYMSRRKS